MSTKQLARTVADGHLVRFTPLAGEPVEGYIGGMDDYHWMVVTPSVEIVLVHKSAPTVEINPLGTPYADEPNHDLIEKIIRPFRDHLQESGLTPMRPLSPVSATEGKSA